jgi:hypothetical protein
MRATGSRSSDWQTLTTRGRPSTPMKWTRRKSCSGAWGRHGAHPRSTSQIATFINGIGSLGAIIEGVVIGYVADRFGWNTVLYFIILMASAPAYLMYRANAFRVAHKIAI